MEEIEAAVHAARELIGPEVARLRRERGLSQDDLVALTGLSSGVLSRLENGLIDPRLSVLIRVALALGLSGIEELLGNYPTKNLMDIGKSGMKQAV